MGYPRKNWQDLTTDPFTISELQNDDTEQLKIRRSPYLETLKLWKVQLGTVLQLMFSQIQNSNQLIAFNKAPRSSSIKEKTMKGARDRKVDNCYATCN